MLDTSPYPMDFGSLRRGDYLPPERVEAIVDARRTAPDYRLRLLDLRAMVEIHFRSIGDLATVITDQEGLRILTHEEQSRHAPKRARRHMRGMGKAAQEFAGVDVAQLSVEQRQIHDEAQRRHSWRLQQMMKPKPPEIAP